MTAPAPSSGGGPRHSALLCRLDSDGDVLLAGPAVRAAARTARISLLVSASGEAAARLLPDVSEVIVAHAPWSGWAPAPVDPTAVARLVAEVGARSYDSAVIFTSFHQSPLPLALLLRLAGIRRITAASADYPGSLLDIRLPGIDMGDPRHEVERMLDLVAAAGLAGRADPHCEHSRSGRLALHHPLPAAPVGMPDDTRRFVVVHPGASVPARAPDPGRAAQYVEALAAAGWSVVVTGSEPEKALTCEVAGSTGIDLGGQTTLAELATVLKRASCVVVGNTGPAHLAAAVGTPVVSLFSPVVPQRWWRPWGVPVKLLGHQRATCALSRARECPLPGHPCLSGVTPGDVVRAVSELVGQAP